MPLPAPLDATAIAAGTVNRWNVCAWFVLELFWPRVGVGLAAIRGLRCAFRYGPVARTSQSSLLPSMATARIRPWPGPVIAPDVHDPACFSFYLSVDAERVGAASRKQCWNDHPVFRRE